MVTPLECEVGMPAIAFAGGGTGGHLYPALAIADALRAKRPGTRFVFFGTQRLIDHRILSSADCELVTQPFPSMHRAPWRLFRILTGFRQSSLLCRSLFASDRPAVVIGTGGLGSVPAVREAARVGIPTALLNPDAMPGKANRYLADSVNVVFAQWEETISQLPHASRVEVCGCPVRAGFNRATREAGAVRFGLDADRKTLLVTGASQGARTINQAVLANLDFLESQRDWQVLHLTGDPDLEEVQAGYAGRSVRASILPFTEHMPEALAAADLVVSRAGASTLAEITAMGRPAVLMPYPYHRDKHQLANARCLVRVAAARIVHDRIDPEENAPALRDVLEPLMTNADLRNAMAQAARRIGRGHAASQIADRIVELAMPALSAASRETLKAVC